MTKPRASSPSKEKKGDEDRKEESNASPSLVNNHVVADEKQDSESPNTARNNGESVDFSVVHGTSTGELSSNATKAIVRHVDDFIASNLDHARGNLSAYKNENEGLEYSENKVGFGEQEDTLKKFPAHDNNRGEDHTIPFCKTGERKDFEDITPLFEGARPEMMPELNIYEGRSSESYATVSSRSDDKMASAECTSFDEEDSLLHHSKQDVNVYGGKPKQTTKDHRKYKYNQPATVPGAVAVGKSEDVEARKPQNIEKMALLKDDMNGGVINDEIEKTDIVRRVATTSNSAKSLSNEACAIAETERYQVEKAAAHHPDASKSVTSEADVKKKVGKIDKQGKKKCYDDDEVEEEPPDLDVIDEAMATLPPDNHGNDRPDPATDSQRNISSPTSMDHVTLSAHARTSVTSASAENNVTTSSPEQTNLARRTATTSTPGAFRQGGMNGDVDDDEDHFEFFNLSERVADPNVPIATLIPEDDHRTIAVDDINDQLHIAIGEVVSPPEDGSSSEESRNKPRWFNRNRIVVGVLSVVAIISIAIGAGMGRGGEKEPKVEKPISPVMSPTEPPTSAPTTVAVKELKEILLLVSEDSVLSNRTSPQHQAMSWLANEDERYPSLDDTEKIIQRYSLATLFFATGGPDWTSNYGFLSEDDECEWNDVGNETGILFGVSQCDLQGRPSALAIANNNLIGTIPEEIGVLTSLTFLQLAQNELFGSIPQSIGRLAELKNLKLFSNKLSGPLPPTIGSFASIEEFNLFDNSLSGSIPSSIGNWSNVDRILLTNNKLTGTLPSEMGNLVTLTRLLMEQNKLRGTLPDSFENLKNLTQLWLSKNDFTGSMELMCPLSIEVFYADCLGNFFPQTDPQVQCCCCSICCNEQNDCIPNENSAGC